MVFSSFNNTSMPPVLRTKGGKGIMFTGSRPGRPFVRSLTPISRSLLTGWIRTNLSNYLPCTHGHCWKGI